MSAPSRTNFATRGVLKIWEVWSSENCILVGPLKTPPLLNPLSLQLVTVGVGTL